MLSAIDRADVIQQVEEQLGRFGIAGRVVLEGTTLRLSGAGRTVTIECSEFEAWSSATSEQRSRTLDRVVREFVRVRRAAGTSSPASERQWLSWIRPIAVLAVVATGLALAWKWLGVPARDAVTAMASQNQVAAASGSALVATANSPVPASEMCRRVQARVATGGTVGALDVDGWVVELMLLAPDPSLSPTSPRLDAFLSKADGPTPARRLIWGEDAELSSLESPETLVAVTSDPLADVIPGTKSGVRLTWSGKYVAKYFDETTRIRLLRLSAALYEATGASYGALYARCALDANHQVGSWFRAKDLSLAVLSLVASMGLYTEISHVNGADPRVTTPIEQRRIWDSLVDRAPRLDKQKLTLALAEDGAMLAARPGHWHTISFPFQDSNRATRASLRMARLLGVAPRN